MLRYQFIVGVTLSALEEELNQVVNNEHSAKLNQVFYAQGIGFVAVVEHLESTEVLQVEQIDRRTNPIATARAKFFNAIKVSKSILGKQIEIMFSSAKMENRRFPQ
jgi:hypothetical protein